MPLRPQSNEQITEGILAKPHKFVDGKYVEDQFFTPTDFPKYKYQYITAFKMIKKNGKKIKKEYRKLESVIVKSAKAESELTGKWFDTPSKALRIYRKKQKAVAA
jgi:hypothetical protein